MLNLFRCFACGWESESQATAIAVCPSCSVIGSVSNYRREDDLTADLVRLHDKHQRHFDLVVFFVERTDPESNAKVLVAIDPKSGSTPKFIAGLKSQAACWESEERQLIG